MNGTCGQETAVFTQQFLDRMASPLAEGHCQSNQAWNCSKLTGPSKLAPSPAQLVAAFPHILLAVQLLYFALV